MAPGRYSGQPVDVLLELALVVRRRVVVKDAFCGQTVEVRLDVLQLDGRLVGVCRLSQPLDHRAHAATMVSVANATRFVLPDPLGS